MKRLSGQAGAIASGLEQLRRTLIARFRRRGALPQDAEDAIQDAFVRLCLAERTEPIRNPAAFLTTIAIRVRIAQWRALQRHGRLFAAEPVEAFEAVDPAPSPDEVADVAQRLARMWRQLGELSPRTREVFLLHRLEALTCPEISARFVISVIAIEKHIARAAFVLANENRRVD